MVISDQSHTH